MTITNHNARCEQRRTVVKWQQMTQLTRMRIISSEKRQIESTAFVSQISCKSIKSIICFAHLEQTFKDNFTFRLSLDWNTRGKAEEKRYLFEFNPFFFFNHFDWTLYSALSNNTKIWTFFFGSKSSATDVCWTTQISISSFYLKQALPMNWINRYHTHEPFIRISSLKRCTGCIWFLKRVSLSWSSQPSYKSTIFMYCLRQRIIKFIYSKE